MATDPYHTFASELRSSLVSAQALAQTYTRTLSRGGAGAAQRDAQRSAHDDLLDALEALQSDVQDVRASVAVVSKSPERFGLSVGELEERKRFVRECDEEIEKLNRVAGNRPPSGRDTNDMEEGRASGLGDDEPIEAFEREQQQSLLAKQDNTLNLIGSALTNLRSQASTLGQEIVEQVELVGALDGEVDQSQSRLKRAMGRMDELARRSDERCGGWCVWLLVVALMVLLLLVILI